MCKLNKCSNPECSNHVVSNQYELCLVCYKAQQLMEPRHKCANPECKRQIPERFRFCVPCIKAYRAQQEQVAQTFEVRRRLRNELLSEYKSDQLREDAKVTCEVEGYKVVISFDGVNHEFEDRGIVAAREYTRERLSRLAAEKAREDELKLKVELLAEFQADRLRAGAKVTSTKGAQITIAFAGKSYTVYDYAGEERRAAKARAAAEADRQAAFAAACKAEEERKLREAEIATIFEQIKAGTLENAVADRSGKTISVLYDDGRVLSFDDPDVLAEETRLHAAAEAAAKAARKSEKKSRGKSGGKKGKSQSVAA